jgi:hypothetical protein
MNAIFDIKKNTFTLFDDHDKRHVFSCDCEVRNEINQERKLWNPDEVVETMVMNKYEKSYPYMPRPFPKGQWNIIGWRDTDNEKYVEPVFIQTDAYQIVEIWDLTDTGGYLIGTGEYTNDYGYGFHFWSGRTTLGCGRLFRYESPIEIKNLIANYLRVFKKIPLEVV